MTSGAILSDCRKYRFELWRFWDDCKPTILWIMLNPSTADEIENDPTIKKIIRFSQKWGYGSIYVWNLFPYRAKDPGELKTASMPMEIMIKNIDHLKNLDARIKMKILAYGNPPIRHVNVMSIISNCHYLKLTKKGNPYHPLYLKEDLIPIPYRK